MKPNPFPFALNIGTDIVHLPRIARLVSRPNGYLTRFTRRILNDNEQMAFRKRFNLPPGSDVPLESKLYPTHRRAHVNMADTGTGTGTGTGVNGSHNTNTNGDANTNANANTGPNTGISTDMARWLAGRFAAKEAARKAAPGGAITVGWKDVEIRVSGEEEEAENVVPQERGDRGRVGRRRAESESGRPEIVYLDPEGGPGRVGKLSISHDGEYVVATVLAAG